MSKAREGAASGAESSPGSAGTSKATCLGTPSKQAPSKQSMETQTTPPKPEEEPRSPQQKERDKMRRGIFAFDELLKQLNGCDERLRDFVFSSTAQMKTLNSTKRAGDPILVEQEAVIQKHLGRVQDTFQVLVKRLELLYSMANQVKSQPQIQKLHALVQTFVKELDRDERNLQKAFENLKNL
ncbi:unnamed protein product [Amoebophrya sp. A25]|nr:unnamed protein product [Amoebophrya sp. A25]|eukprot:GSA25T00027146001.1